MNGCKNLWDRICNGVDVEFHYDDVFETARVTLYVDDTFVFGTDEKDFRNNLDMLDYKELCHLTINFDKTKIISFATGQDQHIYFYLGGPFVLTLYTLGVICYRNSHFHQTSNQIWNI